VCAQSKTNKQGRDEPIDPANADAFRAPTGDVCRQAFDVYHTSLECGIMRLACCMLWMSAWWRYA
jgi:hypothetical protein